MFPQPENVENKMLRNAIFGLSCDNYFFPKNLTCEVTHILNVSLVNQLEFLQKARLSAPCSAIQFVTFLVPRIT